MKKLNYFRFFVFFVMSLSLVLLTSCLSDPPENPQDNTLESPVNTEPIIDPSPDITEEPYISLVSQIPIIYINTSGVGIDSKKEKHTHLNIFLVCFF